MPEPGVDIPDEPLPPAPQLGDPKMWYESKQMWVSLVAIVAFLYQSKFGWVIPEEVQTSAVILILGVLRAFFTSRPVAWTVKQYERMKAMV